MGRSREITAEDRKQCLNMALELNEAVVRGGKPSLDGDQTVAIARTFENYVAGGRA